MAANYCFFFASINISLTNFNLKLVIQNNFYSGTRLAGLIEMHTKHFELAALHV